MVVRVIVYLSRWWNILHISQSYIVISLEAYCRHISISTYTQTHQYNTYSCSCNRISVKIKNILHILQSYIVISFEAYFGPTLSWDIFVYLEKFSNSTILTSNCIINTIPQADLVQQSCNSIVNALKLRLSCTHPSIYSLPVSSEVTPIFPTNKLPSFIANGNVDKNLPVIHPAVPRTQAYLGEDVWKPSCILCTTGSFA